jgi:hypothetical protein
VLDFGESLLDLGDLVAIGVEELGLVLLYYVLDFPIHLVDRFVEVSVVLVERLRHFDRDELSLALH